MKKNEDVSRRAFLSKGAAAAVASSIIAIPAITAQSVKAPNGNAPGLVPTPSPCSVTVYTRCTQTLTGKTVGRFDPITDSEAENVLGTDYVNIREF